MCRQSLIFFIWYMEYLVSCSNISTFVVLRQPVTILVTAFTTPEYLTSNLFILNRRQKLILLLLKLLQVSVRNKKERANFESTLSIWFDCIKIESIYFWINLICFWNGLNRFYVNKLIPSPDLPTFGWMETNADLIDCLCCPK